MFIQTGPAPLKDRIQQLRNDTVGALRKSQDLSSGFTRLKSESYDCYNACYPAYSYASEASYDNNESDYSANGAGLLGALDGVQPKHTTLQTDGDTARTGIAAEQTELQRIHNGVNSLLDEAQGEVRAALEDALGCLHNGVTEQAQVGYQPDSGLSDAQHGLDQARQEGAIIAADTVDTNISWNARFAMMDIDDARSAYIHLGSLAGQAFTQEQEVSPEVRAAVEALDRALAKS